jgi:ATP-dependent Zn protease
VLQKLKKEIKVEYMQGTDVLTFQTYGQIVHNTFPLVKDEYKRLTLESREKQRSLMKEPKKYMDALIEYLTNTEALILEGQRALVKAVGL